MSLILTAAPDFADMALAELRQAQPTCRLEAEFVPGVWHVILDNGFFDLALAWQQQPPIFVRHISPVQETVSLTGNNTDMVQLERLVRREFADLLDPEMPFSVQTRLLAKHAYKRYRVNVTLSDALVQMTGAPLDIRQPQQILSVVLTAQTGFLGLSLAQHNLSDWAGGEHRLAQIDGPIRRSALKLIEALAVFKITLPPRGVALELGGAPGDWAWVLRQREQYVTAVTPYRLHVALQTDPNLRHKQMTPDAYLAKEPDKFDLIVNNMRLDARDSARLTVAYARQLYRHGIVIMTLKLPANGRDMALDHAFNILKSAYDIVAARHLFHNRSEITLYLRKK